MPARTRGIHDRPVARTPIAVFDFETTGLNPGHDRVIEVSIIRIDPGRCSTRSSIRAGSDCFTEDDSPDTLTARDAGDTLPVANCDLKHPGTTEEQWRRKSFSSIKSNR
jgi:DNA polymerase III epsilon subunit-like protein